MAGRGPAPKDPGARVRSGSSARGEWRQVTATGWQHGKRPALPSGLTPDARATWETWFGAWFTAFWGPEDVPALRMLIRLYDAVNGGEWRLHGELRRWMDTFGITPKGQQDRRWRRPAEESSTSERKPRAKSSSRYEHLKPVP